MYECIWLVREQQRRIKSLDKPHTCIIKHKYIYNLVKELCNINLNKPRYLWGDTHTYKQVNYLLAIKWVKRQIGSDESLRNESMANKRLNA